MSGPWYQKKTPDRPTRNPPRVERSFYATENTEVAEALGSLASHSAGLRIRTNHHFLGFRDSGSPRRRCRGRSGRIETTFTGKPFLRVFAVKVFFTGQPETLGLAPGTDYSRICYQPLLTDTRSPHL
jgi:hypothetical protein